MERLAKGTLAATRGRSRCSEITGPSRRGRMWVLCAAPSYFCVPIFLHFVSFQICAADNRLQPFRKFFPTGHPKRNGPPRRNEMPSRNARGNRRRGRAGICGVPAVKKSPGGPAWPAAKKALRATGRAPVLPAVRRSGGCRRMSPCPETPCPVRGIPVPVLRIRSGRSRRRSGCPVLPVPSCSPGATPLLPGQDRVPTARETGMDVVPCIRLPGLPDERRPAYIAADKSLAGHAGRDGDLLRPGPTHSTRAGFR